MALIIPPNGQGPLGFFVPFDVRRPPPDPILADQIDPKTNEFLSLQVGSNVIDAQVQIAVSVVRGSGSAVTEDGQLFKSIRKMTDDLALRVEAEARQALRRLTNAGDIKINSITVDRFDSSQAAELVVKYRNLRANNPDKEQELRVPLEI